MTKSEEQAMDELQQLRQKLSALDVQLLEMVAERQKIVADIGRVKSASGKGTRDYAREKVVLNLARETAARVGIDEAIGEELFRFLIRISLATQEHDKVMASEAGGGQRALVIGGAGQMGQWFVRFLTSQGYEVDVCDPAGSVTGHKSYADLQAVDLNQDLIVIATPVKETVDVLQRLALEKPKGMIFDISSVKGPLVDALQSLIAAGCRVASIHPLFGPDAELLSGRNVIFVNVGDDETKAAVRSLFSSTMAEQVEMSLDAHDKVMAYVLGMSHAVNIAFFNALSQSGEDARELARLSSTTFDAQLDIAKHVAQENPYLYFEIQSLNDHSPRALFALLNAITQVAGKVVDKDRDGFVELMEQGKCFLEGRPEIRP